MSRVIKFRAWDGERMRGIGKNEWFSIRSDGMLSFGQHEDGKIALMQFTGLTDRDGVDVYESDVIGFSYGIPPVGVVAEVVFIDGSFFALTPGHTPTKCLLNRLGEYVGEFYVRGNIHENPELLEAKP